MNGSELIALGRKHRSPERSIIPQTLAAVRRVESKLHVLSRSDMVAKCDLAC